MTGDNSDRYLPTELWREVLSCLPVKSLLRFRCVSKSLQSMTDDLDFCRLHLHRSSNNRQDIRLLVVQRETREEGPLSFMGIERINCFTLFANAILFGRYLTLPKPHDLRYWKTLSSMDGLVMLVGDERGVLYPSSPPKLLLWNPSIRKSLVLPPSPKVPFRTRYVDMGFGYDPLINDYKHVRIAHHIDGSPIFVAIYTFGLGSWKTIPFQSKGCLSGRWVDFRFCTPCRSRGCLFSIALINQFSKDEKLVLFDLSNEVFMSTNLPEAEEWFTSVEKKLILVDDECLFVKYRWDGGIAYRWNGGIAWRLEIPETDPGSMYWTERYLIKSMNGMWTLLSPQSNGGMLAIDYVEAHERKLLLQIINFPSMGIRFFDFVESLILHK